MKNFFKMVTANLFAISIACFVLFGFLFIFLVGLSAAKQVEVAQIEEGSILVIDLGMNVTDSPQLKSIGDLIGEAVSESTIPTFYLLELLDAIEQATYDDRIAGIYLHGTVLPENYGSGFPVLKEIRQALDAFAAVGKPIYAYSVNPSMRDYFLMSSASQLTLNPFGLVSIHGLASERIYLSNAFEKYGIGVQTTRVGKYKSAVEMFTSDAMSQADRQQLEALIADLWTEIVAQIAAGRDLEIAALQELSEAQGFFPSDQAKELGLVDEVAYMDEVLESISEAHVYDSAILSFKQVGLGDYMANIDFGSRNAWEAQTRIAVVYAEGDIVDGEGTPLQVGGDRLARDLRVLRQDDEVAAVVLRVNSPGGSAVASELIQRELRLTREQKPVVVSMGSFAASGGYWISAYADRIFAQPSTITGSIGVFGLIFNVKDLASNLGVTFDGIKTAPYADLFTVSRPKTKEEMALIQQFTDFIYDEFIRKVSEGRDLSEDAVKALAQGRVWSGEDALEIGLVDELGGLSDAINHAVDLAGVGDDWSLMQVPEDYTFEETLESLLSGSGLEPPVVSARRNVLEEALIRLEDEWQSLKALNDPQGVYLRLPYNLHIR